MSRLLGWVRSREEYEAETGETVTDEHWSIADSVRELPVLLAA